MAESALHLTEASFDTELGKHDELMMVDFWAEWCAPCRAIAPTLEELVRELIYYGVSAITLGITGSEHTEGLRACTSLIQREQLPVLEQRLAQFQKDHPIK